MVRKVLLIRFCTYTQNVVRHYVQINKSNESDIIKGIRIAECS